MTWLGPVLIAMGMMTLGIAFYTECKNPHINIGHWREIALFTLGAIGVIAGAVLIALGMSSVG